MARAEEVGVDGHMFIVRPHRHETGLLREHLQHRSIPARVVKQHFRTSW